ncbi:hypothetical protein [Nocardia salmonicida]|uniref:hypothetical protein n=1 Tax=Nocardia salmonicida TaxID=53431 RepID=UPI000B3170C7|nr:hypothetical protein [Nocardia salmonicida]MBC7299778.1 hypothetical protein [Nocardia sp.]
MAELSEDELAEIRLRLDAGMSPEAIAASIARMADLDEEDEIVIRDAAIALASTNHS